MSKDEKCLRSLRIKISPKIPNSCPLMKKCKGSVTYEEWECVCDTSTWIICEFAQEEAKKYKKNPALWKMVNKLLE